MIQDSSFDIRHSLLPVNKKPATHSGRREFQFCVCVASYAKPILPRGVIKPSSPGRRIPRTFADTTQRRAARMASSGSVQVLAAKFLIGNGNIGKTAARWQPQKSCWLTGGVKRHAYAGCHDIRPTPLLNSSLTRRSTRVRPMGGRITLIIHGSQDVWLAWSRTPANSPTVRTENPRPP